MGFTSFNPSYELRQRDSQLHPPSVLCRPVPRVIHPDRLLRQREIGQWLPSRLGAFHEILDFLQIAARPFLFEADILPAGLPVDFIGDVDAGELLLAWLVANQVIVRPYRDGRRSAVPV